MNAFNSKFAPKISRPLSGGTQHIYKFENGYGASVVQHQFSYGRDEGKWELAVTKYVSDDEWHIEYQSGITDDVIGHLSEPEVADLLEQIAAIKATSAA